MLSENKIRQIVKEEINNLLNENRLISDIASDIADDWRNVNYAAKPYLNAMFGLGTINDRYGMDDARSIVLYFLSNASTYRGPRAKELKAELKSLLKK